MLLTLTFTAGQRVEFSEPADFFRLLTDTTSSEFDLQLFSHNAVVSEAFGVRTGYSERMVDGKQFDRFSIKALSATTLTFVTRLRSVVTYDQPPNGNVTVTSVINNGAFSQAQATVTNVSAQLVAANPQRRYLMVQNKDAAGSVFVNLAGAAATEANGILIEPGGNLELSARCPTGALFFIGDVATNTNVVIVEG